MKPFLILQLRPETEASDDEYQAILRKAGLSADETRRIRLDQNTDLSSVVLDDHAGVIVGGGPACVSDAEHEKTSGDRQMEAALLGLLPQITGDDFPFLGCCYGIGILAHHLGAPVSKERYGEPVGAVDCQLTDAGRNDPLLAGVSNQFQAFVGHKEAVQALPGGCEHLVASTPCPYQMIRYKQHVYASQFHPEADSDGFEVRINIYRNKGYFPAEDAQKLIDMCREEAVHMPELILRNFVNTYRS